VDCSLTSLHLEGSIHKAHIASNTNNSIYSLVTISKFIFKGQGKVISVHVIKEHKRHTGTVPVTHPEH